MRYFTIEELCKSETARRKGIDNSPTNTAEVNILRLVNNVLDPLRTAWGKPIVVSSGYRCAKLNKAVGGASSSQHTLGEAADIEDASRRRGENKRLFELIIKLDLPFDQIINEFDYDWIHVSCTGASPRKQILAAIKQGGKTTYRVIK